MKSLRLVALQSTWKQLMEEIDKRAIKYRKLKKGNIELTYVTGRNTEIKETKLNRDVEHIVLASTILDNNLPAIHTRFVIVQCTGFRYAHVPYLSGREIR